MSGTSRAGSYRCVLRLPRARRVFAVGLVGRSAYGVLPLPLLFTFQAASGSFATAGLAMALFGAATITMPLKSRAVDRLGARTALPSMAVGLAGILVVIAVLAARQGRLPGTLCCGLALAAGVLAPPLGPAMRMRWRDLCAGTALVPTAYALDAVCEEGLYLLAPAAAGGVLAIAAAWVPLLVAAGLIVIGTVGMSRRSPPASASGPTAKRPVLGPIRHRALLHIVACVGVLGLGTALIETALAGFASAHGTLGLAGYLQACLALGSLLGGSAYGRRAAPANRSWQRRIGLCLAGVALAAFALCATTTIWLMALLLTAGGLTISPAFVIAYLAADRAVSRAERTEANTWINTANNIAASLGTAIAAAMLAHHSAQRVFLLAAALLTASALVIVTSSRNPQAGSEVE